MQRYRTLHFVLDRTEMTQAAIDATEALFREIEQLGCQALGTDETRTWPTVVVKESNPEL